MVIRKTTEADIPQLLRLMRELAEFEKYADAFVITKRSCASKDFAVHRQISILLSPTKTVS